MQGVHQAGPKHRETFMINLIRGASSCRLAVLLALALAVCAPALARAQGGFNLSWDDCGTHGTELKAFACNTNSGTAFVAIGSFEPPAMLPEFVGLSGELRVVTSDALPNWWKHGSGQCRGLLGLAVNFDFTAGLFSCVDFFAGNAAGNFTYQSSFESDNQARVLFSTAVPFDDRGPIDPSTEYLAFKLNLMRSKTTGTGSCAGCIEPALIVLREMQLFQPPEVGNDPILTATLDRAWVRWQGDPLVSVDAISPTGGEPGTIVTITGDAFLGALGVGFGGDVPAAFTIVSNTEIHATVPDGARTGVIRVSGVPSPTSFTVAPLVQAFSPAQAPIGHEVRVFGFNFLGTTSVAFAGTPATFTIVDDGLIRATIPAGATDGTIGVTNPGGTGYSPSVFPIGPVVTAAEVTMPDVVLALDRAVARGGALAVSLALPSTAPATLEAYDVTGRRWASERLEPSAAGALDVELRGTHSLRAGVYFLKLRQAEASISRRFVIVK
jgi:hypothetical protein